MTLYTTVQLAELMGKAERTIQLWIQIGKLPARRISGNLYEVEENVVQQYIPRVLERSLQDQIDALERRMTALETILSEPVKYTSPPVKDRLLRAPQAQNSIVANETPAQDIPDGAVPLTGFAQAHSMNGSTVRWQVQQGVIQVWSRPKPGRPHEQEHYVLPGQMATIIAAWRSNRQFRECSSSACPCH